MTKTLQKVRLSTINKLSKEMFNQVTIATFQADGSAFIPVLLTAHVESLRIGVHKHLENPGTLADDTRNERSRSRYIAHYTT